MRIDSVKYILILVFLQIFYGDCSLKKLAEKTEGKKKYTKYSQTEDSIPNV